MAIRIDGKGYNSTTNDVKIGYGGNNEAASKMSYNGDAKGTYHMAANPNLYEIQRGNNFEFVVAFNADDQLLKAGETTSDSTGKYSGALLQEVIRMSVSQAAIPHFQQNPIEVKRGNTTLKYAGVPTFSDGQITLNDYIGANTLGLLMAWQQLSYNVKTEKVGLASDYKKQATLIEYTPDLQVVRSWTLYGCWISNMSETDFSSDDNGKHTITITITYDKAMMNDGAL